MKRKPPKTDDLSYPDTNYRPPGGSRRETVQAMRDAKGDRRVAAQLLGITLPALTSRLSVIRGIQKALEQNGGSK